MSYLGQQLGQGQAERFVYTATGGETSVTTDDAGRGIAYTVGQVDVYLNGAKLINGSDFTATTGTSITGLAALTAADVLEVFALSIFQASDTVSASVGGTFNGNVTVDADLSVTGTTTITTADINGGAIDGTTIGGTTPAAGTFSGLTAGTFISNTGATSPLATITSTGEQLLLQGATNGVGQSVDLLFEQKTTTSATRAGGKISSIAANSYTAGSGGTNDADLVFYSTLDGVDTEALRITSAGNVGIGVTPEAWRTAGSEKVLQIDTASIYNNSANDCYLNNNWYLNSSAQSIYIESDYATSFSSQDGKFIWYQAPSGTAGNTISFTQAMTLDNSGNLLVGTTGTSWTNTPGFYVFNQSAVNATRDGNEAVNLNRLTSDGDIAIFRKDGTSVGQIGAFGGSLFVGGANSGVFFNGNGMEPTSGGSTRVDNTENIGSASWRFKDLYLSGGVYLGGTGSANQLDDYEEGTWTPVFSSASGTVTINTSYDTLSYTKIGRAVHIYGHLRISSVSTPSGDFSITGLPFTVVSGVQEGRGNACMTIYDASKGSADRYQVAPFFFQENNTYLRLQTATYDGGWTAGAGDEFFISHWYRIA